MWNLTTTWPQLHDYICSVVLFTKRCFISWWFIASLSCTTMPTIIQINCTTDNTSLYVKKKNILNPWLSFSNSSILKARTIKMSAKHVELCLLKDSANWNSHSSSLGSCLASIEVSEKSNRCMFRNKCDQYNNPEVLFSFALFIDNLEKIFLSPLLTPASFSWSLVELFVFPI